MKIYSSVKKELDNLTLKGNGHVERMSGESWSPRGNIGRDRCYYGTHISKLKTMRLRSYNTVDIEDDKKKLKRRKNALLGNGKKATCLM